MATDSAVETTQFIATYLRNKAYYNRIAQGVIAERAQLSRSAVNDYLNGNVEMRLTAFLDVCAAIGVNPDDVVRAAAAHVSEAGPDVTLTEGRMAQ